MIDIRLRHVRRKVARGRAYYYFEPPYGDRIRLPGEPGSLAFLAALEAAQAALSPEPDASTVAGLIAAYERSEGYQALRPTTRATYDRYLALIRTKFGPGRLVLIERNYADARGQFKAFRREFAEHPAKADMLWAVMKTLFAFAVEDGLLRTNPCQGGGRLYRPDRRNMIWGDGDIARFESVASPELVMAMRLALDTGMRQGDLLALTWSAFDGQRINWQTSKRGRRVSILLGEETREMLLARQKGGGGNRGCSEEAEAEHKSGPRVIAGPSLASTHILTNSYGRPWTSDGFKTSWGKTFARSGINEPLHFHDLRGTAVTLARRDGATIDELCSRFSWKIGSVTTLLEAHYLADDQRAGDRIVERRRKVVRIR